MAQPRRAKTKVKASKPIKGARILVVEARSYNEITNALLEGAKVELDAANCIWDRVSVPGSLEIPTAIAIAVGISSEPGTLTRSQMQLAASSSTFAPSSSALVISL